MFTASSQYSFEKIVLFLLFFEILPVNLFPLHVCMFLLTSELSSWLQTSLPKHIWQTFFRVAVSGCTTPSTLFFCPALNCTSKIACVAVHWSKTSQGCSGYVLARWACLLSHATLANSCTSTTRCEKVVGTCRKEWIEVATVLNFCQQTKRWQLGRGEGHY